MRYAYSGATAFIAHSKEDRDNLLRLRPGVPVQLNPHPTYDVFTSGETPSGDEAKASLGLSGKRVLLFFGFIRQYKGLQYLIEALSLLDPADGYHLLIVGEFYEDRKKYSDGLARLERQGQLTLVDSYVPNEDLPRYFAASDLVVAPYLSATQSGVIQIAYAFERPVIATTVGGLPETVIDGKTGYLVPPASAQAIAESAHDYFSEADHAAFRKDILEESRKYSWDRMIDTIESVHADLSTP